MHSYRSHTCADLNKTNVGDSVRLSGWVHRIRDHGGVLFVDLRVTTALPKSYVIQIVQFSQKWRQFGRNGA